MSGYVFRWIENLKGELYPERAMKTLPNHNALRMVEEHELTEQQGQLNLDQLAQLFPKPKQVRTVQ